MGWFDFLKKSNPVQREIGQDEGTAQSGNKNKITAANAFELDSIVNRCTNILVDNSAEVNFDIKDNFSFTPMARVNKKQLNEILNIRPNPYMDSSLFRRLTYLDFYFGGRCFMYWDGTSLYHLPEGKMEVVASTEQGSGFIDHFLFDGTVTFFPNEIIFIKDNSFKSFGSSQIAATSRYMSAHNDVIRKDKLNTFKEKFIDNGTILGLILESEQVLNRNFKNRILEDIKLNYNSNSGKFSNTAFILDGGIKAKATNQTSISDLGVTEDRKAYNDSICVALGIPPVLLEGGNNANIRPNIQLLFYMTLLPSLKKFESAFEMFFGFDIKLDTRDVPAMLPDVGEETSRIVQLVNNGIITGDEGRIELRMDPTNDPLMTTIRIPQNVAGSATGVSGEQGGAPKK